MQGMYPNQPDPNPSGYHFSGPTQQRGHMLPHGRGPFPPQQNFPMQQMDPYHQQQMQYHNPPPQQHAAFTHQQHPHVPMMDDMYQHAGRNMDPSDPANFPSVSEWLEMSEREDDGEVFPAFMNASSNYNLMPTNSPRFVENMPPFEGPGPSQMHRPPHSWQPSSSQGPYNDHFNAAPHASGHSSSAIPGAGAGSYRARFADEPYAGEQERRYSPSGSPDAYHTRRSHSPTSPAGRSPPRDGATSYRSDGGDYEGMAGSSPPGVSGGAVDERFAELEQRVREREAVRIQAFFRGYSVRKRLADKQSRARRTNARAYVLSHFSKTKRRGYEENKPGKDTLKTCRSAAATELKKGKRKNTRAVVTSAHSDLYKWSAVAEADGKAVGKAEPNDQLYKYFQREADFKKQVDGAADYLKPKIGALTSRGKPVQEISQLGAKSKKLRARLKLPKNGKAAAKSELEAMVEREGLAQGDYNLRGLGLLSIDGEDARSDMSSVMGARGASAGPSRDRSPRGGGRAPSDSGSTQLPLWESPPRERSPGGGGEAHDPFDLPLWESPDEDEGLRAAGVDVAGMKRRASQADSTLAARMGLGERHASAADTKPVAAKDFAAAMAADPSLAGLGRRATVLQNPVLLQMEQQEQEKAAREAKAMKEQQARLSKDPVKGKGSGSSQGKKPDKPSQSSPAGSAKPAKGNGWGALKAAFVSKPSPPVAPVEVGGSLSVIKE